MRYALTLLLIFVCHAAFSQTPIEIPDSGFDDASLQDWIVFNNALDNLQWTSADEEDDPASGSLMWTLRSEITLGEPSGFESSCLEISGGGHFRVKWSHRRRLDSTTSVWVRLVGWSQPACNQVGQPELPQYIWTPASPHGEWEAVTSPELVLTREVVSLRVSFIAVGRGEDGIDALDFDNVSLVQLDRIFADGFETGDLQAW